MADWDILKLWNNGENRIKSTPKYSLEEIAQYRQQQSSESSSSTNRILLFDIIYKLIVGIGIAILLFISNYDLPGVILSVSSLVLFGLLIIKNLFLRRELLNIDESGSVIEVLKQKYKFHTKYYGQFIFLNSITHPFFVFTGFQFYHLLKYEENRLFQLINDPVTYVFLIVAFIIPYISQRLVYKQQIQELKDIIHSTQDQADDIILINKTKILKRKRTIIFSLLLLIGILVMLLVLKFII